MKRALTFVLSVVVLAGCRRTAVGPEPGAEAPQLAVQQFLAAAKGQDLQAMSAVFGTAEGPLRDRAPRQEVERRMIIMTCHLRHDESRIGAPQSGEGGRVSFRVDLTQGTKTAAPVFKTVKATRSGRWFVEEFDLVAVRSFCGSSQTPPTDASAPR